MENRELIEIPLDDRDAELLPPLHEYFIYMQRVSFSPVADPNVIARDEQTKETITLGEGNTFPPLVFSPADAQSIHVPVLFVIVNRDNVFCTPPQCSEAQLEPNLYPVDAQVEVRVIPGTGHSLNLHFTAPVFFGIAREWSDRHFGN